MKVLSQSIIYENPLPQLRSRQSAFPSLCKLPNGDILASHVLGEAFESVDATTCLSISRDGGRSFAFLGPMFSPESRLEGFSDSCKLTLLPDGRLCAFGYAYDRKDPSLPIGNPETGGLLDDLLLVSYSEDLGKSWTPWQCVDCAWGPHVEASAPLYVLQDGARATPITGFADWQGRHVGRNCGRLLRSDDGGMGWSDDVICMAFPGDEISCFEQRMCQLSSGTLVCIGWNENMVTGELLENHFTLSTDGGKSFSSPMGTGIFGQASSVMALPNDRLLALHAMRRDTNTPGILACIVDLSEGEWDIVDSAMIWEPSTPVLKDSAMADIFAYLAFGQPSAILLEEDLALCCFWFRDNGQYKTACIRLDLHETAKGY